MFLIGNLLIATAASVKAAVVGIGEIPRYARWYRRATAK